MNDTDKRVLTRLWPIKFRVTAGRAVDDPEKLITPGILYASRRSLNFIVRLLAIGWWDWRVSFLFAFRTAPTSEESSHE